MTISVTIDAEAVNVRFDTMTDKIAKNLMAAASKLAPALQQYIQTEKLNAPPGYNDKLLHRITGDLSRSIQQTVTQTSNGVVGNVFSNNTVDYAAVHEYGGTDWYDIYPKNAKALAWGGGWNTFFSVKGRDMKTNNMTFAKHVHHPPAKERSFMRTSLAENADKIVETLQQAVAEAVAP